MPINFILIHSEPKKDNRCVSITLQIAQLKSRIENTPNGNAPISQKWPNIAKTFLHSHEVVFQAMLSSIRGFACHSLLDNLHCTCLRCCVALIRPLELISATLVYACVYMSRAAHVSEAALRAASVKIHAHASFH